MKVATRIALLAIAGLLLVGTPSAGAWYSYFGPGTFRQPGAGGPWGAGTPGWNYHTNNRVYRPTGHPFYLSYYNGSTHWSATNWSTNPFYFAAFGYNLVGCDWEYWNDGSPTVDPVTCQADT